MKEPELAYAMARYREGHDFLHVRLTRTLVSHLPGAAARCIAFPVLPLLRLCLSPVFHSPCLPAAIGPPTWCCISR